MLLYILSLSHVTLNTLNTLSLLSRWHVEFKKCLCRPVAYGSCGISNFKNGDVAVLILGVYPHPLVPTHRSGIRDGYKGSIKQHIIFTFQEKCRNDAVSTFGSY